MTNDLRYAESICRVFFFSPFCHLVFVVTSPFSGVLGLIDWLIEFLSLHLQTGFFFLQSGVFFLFFFCNCVRITPNPFRTRPTRKKYGCFLYHQFCLLFPVRTKLPTANRGFTVCCLNNFYFSVLSFLVGCLTMYKVPKMPQHGFFFFSFLLFIEICWNLLIKNNE